jgi:phosphoribosylglycinamide formyltransferase-1
MTINKNLRFAFYVSGNASRLIKVIEKFPEIINTTFIVINDEAPNIKLANLLKIADVEYIEYSYEKMGLRGKEKNDYTSKLLLQKFKEFNINISFCFGGRILNGELLEVYKNRIINFHPSILPMFPGVKSIDQAINANSFLLGNSAHFVDAGTDTGPVIMQSILHSNTFSNYEAVLDLQLPMIYQIYWWLIENRIRVEDNKVIIDKSNYNIPIFYPQLEINK